MVVPSVGAAPLVAAATSGVAALSVTSVAGDATAGDSGSAAAGSSTGSTEGHRYAKYKPAETMIPSTSARRNGSQITP